MHDTVVKVKRRIRSESPRDDLAPILSERMQAVGLNRALTDPLSAQLQLLYRDAWGWTTLADDFVRSDPVGETVYPELLIASRRVRTIVADLLPFLERAEENLSDREEITHRESGYEREVAPFSRIDSTQPIRDALESKLGLNARSAHEGGQAEADLLKIVYLDRRLDDDAPKPADFYAMVFELTLDCRRHLMPAFDEESDLMKALREKSGAS